MSSWVGSRRCHQTILRCFLFFLLLIASHLIADSRGRESMLHKNTTPLDILAGIWLFSRTIEKSALPCVTFMLPSGFFAKRLRPVTRLRELEISFFSLFHFTFSSFLCQVVTATANSWCGTASVAHKLDLIGAGIMDHGHGESATRCESVQTHAPDDNIVMASGAEWMAGYVFCFLNIIPNWWYKLGLKVLETCALTLVDAMEEKQGCKGAEIITKMSSCSPERYVESSLMEKQRVFLQHMVLLWISFISKWHHLGR